MANKTLELTIAGMHCDACVEKIRGALHACAGVAHADVSLGRATIEFDEAHCSTGKLFDAVRAAGDFSLSSFRTV
jgi:copper chaperone CopZ